MPRFAVPFHILVASLLCAGPAFADELKLARSAKSGVESLIAHERLWDRRNCEALPTTVTITRTPTNGAVSVVEGTSKIPKSTPRSGSTGRCAGMPITGSQVMYRSNPGYRGIDTVSYDVVYGSGRKGSTRITITVR
jgi:hypothetical protein